MLKLPIEKISELINIYGELINYIRVSKRVYLCKFKGALLILILDSLEVFLLSNKSVNHYFIYKYKDRIYIDIFEKGYDFIESIDIESTIGKSNTQKINLNLSNYLGNIWVDNRNNKTYSLNYKYDDLAGANVLLTINNDEITYHWLIPVHLYVFIDTNVLVHERLKQPYILSTRRNSLCNNYYLKELRGKLINSFIKKVYYTPESVIECLRKTCEVF